jgi:hypothetical protein
VAIDEGEGLVDGLRVDGTAALEERFLVTEVALVVVSGQVVDAAGGWSADGGVVSVMVVAVEEAVKTSGSTGV